MKSRMSGYRCLALLVVSALPAHTNAWRAHNSSIIDHFGRERFWRGVNLVYKSAPYVPRLDAPDLGLYRLSFTEADARLLRSLGLNIVRLAVMWAGIEPTKGQFNETYVGQIRSWIRLLGKHHIDVVLEFHQDALAEMFCGEGLPIWAATNEELLHVKGSGFPWPVGGVTRGAWPMLPVANATGVYAAAHVPSRANCMSHGWGDYLAAYALLKNVHQLYTNDGDKRLRDAFARYWAKVAASFKNEPNVVGYELLNEPPPLLSIYSFPGAMDGKFLEPFYNAVAASIREADPEQERLIIFEPTTWSNMDPRKTHGVPTAPDFSAVPGGRRYINQSSLSFHYYSWVNKPNERVYLQERAKVASKLGKLPSMITEWNWGSCSALPTPGPDPPRSTCDGDEMAMFDEFKISAHMAWTYKSFLPSVRETPFVPTCTGCGGGLLQEGNCTDPDRYRVSWFDAYMMARSYPMAVQGRLLGSFRFDQFSNAFEMQFMLDPLIAAPTVVYVNTRLVNPNGSPNEIGLAPRFPSREDVRVTLTPAKLMSWEWTAEDLISIKALHGAKANTTVMVRIAAS